MINTPDTTPLLVDTREAARLLCVSERTVANIVARGDLTPVRLGRSVRFDINDIRALIERKKNTPPTSTLPTQTPN